MMLVGADLDLSCFGGGLRPCPSGLHVEADDHAFDGDREVDVALGDGADARVDDR